MNQDSSVSWFCIKSMRSEFWTIFYLCFAFRFCWLNPQAFSSEATRVSSSRLYLNGLRLHRWLAFKSCITSFYQILNWPVKGTSIRWESLYGNDITTLQPPFVELTFFFAPVLFVHFISLRLISKIFYWKIRFIIGKGRHSINSITDTLHIIPICHCLVHYIISRVHVLSTGHTDHHSPTLYWPDNSEN